MSPAERAAHLTEELGLNTDQAEKVKNILTEQEEKFMDLRSDVSGDRDEMRRARRELREKTDKLILSVLDDTQKGKYIQLQAERRERFRSLRGRGEQ
jgi:hypothetical protein